MQASAHAARLRLHAAKHVGQSIGAAHGLLPSGIWQWLRVKRKPNGTSACTVGESNFRQCSEAGRGTSLL